MRDSLFHLRRQANISIQVQIRQMLVSAILEGQLPGGEPLPSCRQMAKTLKVSRNTVVLAYQGLVDDGYLTSRERSGFYVSPEIQDDRPKSPALKPVSDTEDMAEPANAPDWEKIFRVRPSRQHNILKPADWKSYPYPFIYGQVDHTLFPIAAWRECSRQAQGTKAMESWTCDAHGEDDPLLIEQIRTRLLPRRGVMASNDEILITMGAQNALYMLTSLLIGDKSTIAIEDPGYPDMRNIFSLKTTRLKPIPVDGEGMVVDGRLSDVNMVYVTPSHQFPTTATMSMARRQQLLGMAVEKDFLIIEDDYEPEASYIREPTPALKSLDRNGRVIYVGSMSKTMFPGLRLGYMVGPSELIAEARAIRRLMYRHSPTNNQRTTALFMSLGHHDALVHRLHRAYRARWERLGDSLNRHLPDSATAPSIGGTSFWVCGPEGLDADRLAERARDEGLIIEPGRVHFISDKAPANYFRLGFSSISIEQIEPGIRLLAKLIHGR
ncbi:MAG: PLP-dependent aminotransferase family protein [Rhodospirillaceae bacterium]|nr:PLP-dependent aminotransferase family protein [Rhodospirillaceae bacterium]